MGSKLKVAAHDLQLDPHRSLPRVVREAYGVGIGALSEGRIRSGKPGGCQQESDKTGEGSHGQFHGWIEGGGDELCTVPVDHLAFREPLRREVGSVGGMPTSTKPPEGRGPSPRGLRLLAGRRARRASSHFGAPALYGKAIAVMPFSS